MATRKPVVSIVMATFNRAVVIDRAIASVQQQDYGCWELIIWDDGSTDNTDEKVQPYLVDNRVTYIKSGNNRGVNYARNRAIERSKGDWVIILDSDNALFPDSLSIIVDAIGHYPSIYVHKFCVLSFSGRPLSSVGKEYVFVDASSYLKASIKGEFHTATHRYFMEKTKFFEDINGGEGIIWKLIVLDAGKICFHPEITLKYDMDGRDRLSVRRNNFRRLYMVHRKDVSTLWKAYLVHSPLQLLIATIKMVIYFIPAYVTAV